MKEGGKGGANTITGIRFEKDVSLASRFRALPGYEVADSESAGLYVRYEGCIVARMFQEHEFYRFLEEEGVEWRSLISRQLLPDDALLVVVRDTLFIIEIKYQEVGGPLTVTTCLAKSRSSGLDCPRRRPSDVVIVGGMRGSDSAMSISS